MLKVKVGRAGSVVLGGSEVKPRSKTASAAGKVMLPIASKGKTANKLRKAGKAKVKFDAPSHRLQLGFHAHRVGHASQKSAVQELDSRERAAPGLGCCASVPSRK